MRFENQMYQKFKSYCSHNFEKKKIQELKIQIQKSKQIFFLNERTRILTQMSKWFQKLVSYVAKSILHRRLTINSKWLFTRKLFLKEKKSEKTWSIKFYFLFLLYLLYLFISQWTLQPYRQLINKIAVRSSRLFDETKGKNKVVIFVSFSRTK